jgi:hypothetical protein
VGSRDSDRDILTGTVTLPHKDHQRARGTD